MIIITGMHRSGTSFTANLAKTVGLDLGPLDKLLVPDKWNQKGYFENIDIVNLNNQIILGDHIRQDLWITPTQQRNPVEKVLLSAYKAFYLLFPEQHRFAQRARTKKRIIEKVSTRYRNIGVKDPRFSLLFRYWYKYGTVKKILYCYRHPFEVANSLKKREHLPLWLGYKIWLYHVDAFLYQIGLLKPEICFINFNNFFSDAHRHDEIERIYNFIEKPYDSVQANRIVKTILDRSLKNNDYHSEALPPPITEAYQRLNRYHTIFRTPMRFIP